MNKDQVCTIVLFFHAQTSDSQLFLTPGNCQHLCLRNGSKIVKRWQACPTGGADVGTLLVTVVAEINLSSAQLLLLQGRVAQCHGCADYFALKDFLRGKDLTFGNSASWWHPLTHPPAASHLP